jgi:serine/threonine protein kinase
VFAAVHPLIGKRAAIKVLRLELCADPFSVERFVDEARIVNQIGHPNIVDVFAFAQLPDHRHYFVMEWLKGESLRTRLARSRISRAEVCALVRPLARALMAAHAHGIVHRDLKPDNVFLVEVEGEGPRVKLLDFGIAKLAHTEHRMEQTASGAIVGTPLYIAPEQAKGLVVDARADVYALGSMMFEMLTGRVPFVANSALEVVALHLMEAPPRVSTLVPDVPRELDDLVLAMMAKDPAARPSLEQVCRVVERARDAPPESAFESIPSRSSAGALGKTAIPQTLPHEIPPRRSLRWLAVPLAVLVVGGIAFIAVGALSSHTEAVTPGDAPRPTPAVIAPPDAAPVVEPPPPPPPPVVPTHTPEKRPSATPAVSSKPTVKPTPAKKPPKPVVKPPAIDGSGNDMLLPPGSIPDRKP